MIVKKYETDWLGSTPIFYNEKTKKISENIFEVIDRETIELDPEGFTNYLAFGYSAFGQTPLRHIKYLPHSSTISLQQDGLILLEKKPDIALPYLEKQTTENQVLGLLENSIVNWEKSTEGDIVLPLSGGFDSRLLNFFIKDKTRVKAFTYGTSINQARSFEVINAKRLAENLGESWQHIPLQEYLNYIPEWEKIYGPSTHAHGMYHMEFYREVAKQVAPGLPLLSGIIGDAWAGSVKIPDLENEEAVVALGYSHGMHADPEQSLLKSTNTLRTKYFDEKKEVLKDKRFRVIESMRFKMTLLSYLLKIPKHFGFKPWSPFLEPEVALAMLTLPEESRANRKWQRDFFAKHEALSLEKHWFKDRKNTLNLQMLQNQTLEPLQIDLLGEYIKPNYIEWINTTIGKAPRTLRLKKRLSLPSSLLAFLPGLHSLPARMGLDPYTLKNEESRALNAYLVLHPIQSVLKMRR